MRRNNNASRGHGGPLRTEHLQLHDLDLELELLKRKREMIEQQQQVLVNNPPYSRLSSVNYGNNKPRPLFPEHQPFGINSNFSQFYDDAQQPQGFGASGLLGKRPINDSPVWQANAPKRFSGPHGGTKKKFGAGPSHKTNNSGSFSQHNKSGPRQQWDNKSFGAQKSTFPSQRFNSSNGSKPHQRDFKPNKVTKPKQPQQVNKLASYPTAERKKFVQKTTKPSKEDEDFSGDQYILRADVVPSQQMAGRLELALGNILKEIKTNHGNAEPHAASFQTQHLNRKMKQAIRERLRGVMLSKPVGKVTAIVEHYRKVFPPETDIEILNIALAEQRKPSQKHLAIKLDSADSAFKYLKINMNRLIGVTLDDMFEKLQKMYEGVEYDKTEDICNKIIQETIDFTKDIEAVTEVKNISQEGIDGKGNESKVEEIEAKDKTNGEAVENVEEKPSENSNEKLGDDVPSSDKPSNDNPIVDDKPLEDVKPTGDEKTSEDNKPPKSDEVTPTVFRKPEWKKIDELIGSLIKRRLPYILPKFKPQLMKMLNAVGSYKVTKTAILEKTQDRLDLENRIEQAEKNMNSTVDLSKNDTVATSTPSHKQAKRFSYMVKILGRPALPKRKIMQTFLDEFKPTSVKKHRNMPLLFVAFGNKEAFDKILAVKETTLGNCTISIRSSQDKTSAQPNESLDNSVLNGSCEKIIGSDLDEQINDLLSSIRDEQESDINNTETGDVEIVPASDNQETASESVPTEEATVTEGTEEITGEDEGMGDNVTDVKDIVENQDAAEVKEIIDVDEAADTVEELKAGVATPTRASSRLANVTPSSIRTRRASRLAQN